MPAPKMIEMTVFAKPVGSNQRMNDAIKIEAKALFIKNFQSISNGRFLKAKYQVNTKARP